MANVTRNDDFNVVFVGAGNVMFGSVEGPWNHALRLEQKLDNRFKLIAVVDPALQRVESVLTAKRRDSGISPAYEHTRTFATLDDFAAQRHKEPTIHAIWVGSPPQFRGTDEPGRDIELQLLKHFPGIPLFIEKPVSTGPAIKALAVAKEITEAKIPCSVGYMLRYSKCIQKMKQVIDENDLTVIATSARYACAYENISKVDWWDKARNCGPIVEQATHFCDISRYLGGEVDISSISATSVEFYEKPGKLSKIPFDETKIAEEQRIPRATAATWKYKSGAVGSLLHTVALQGHTYGCALDVWLDGWHLRLEDPYNEPHLYIRRPGSDQEERYQFEDDDPYFTEVSVFVDLLEKGPKSAPILSSYEDACRTYEFTWAIREASEKTRKIPPEFSFKA